MEREAFQDKLARLNPTWAGFLADLLASGALDTENPDERRKLGYRTNPDGDADVPGAPYTTFRYPACEHCLSRPPVLADGRKGIVDVDSDGAWKNTSTAGILKPNVIMFGESIPEDVKRSAEEKVDEADLLLVVGSSLATYSAWRLVKGAVDRGMGVGVVNVGGVRKEEVFFPRDGVRMGAEREGRWSVAGVDTNVSANPVLEQGDRVGVDENPAAKWLQRVRVGLPSEDVLPGVVRRLNETR